MKMISVEGPSAAGPSVRKGRGGAAGVRLAAVVARGPRAGRSGGAAPPAGPTARDPGARRGSAPFRRGAAREPRRDHTAQRPGPVPRGGGGDARVSRYPSTPMTYPRRRYDFEV